MSAVQRKPALPPRKTHPVADLAALASSPLRSAPAPAADKPVKDQLNVRISRDIMTRLDHALLILSAERGAKLTKADAVEDAITQFLDQHLPGTKSGA